jgi:HlyD family secretion protein
MTVATKFKVELKSRVLVLLFLLAAGFIFIPVFRSILIHSSKNSVSSTNQELLPQKIEVLAMGRLEPDGEIVNVAGPTAERIAQLTVREGDEVEAGAIIAYLDNYQQALSQKDLAYSRLQEIRDQINTDFKLQQAQIDKARTQIDIANTPTLFETDAQKALVRRLEAEHVNAETEYYRWQYLQSQGAVSAQELDAKKLMLQKTLESLNQSKLTLQQLVSKRQVNINSASTDLEIAQINKQRVQSHSGLKSALSNLKVSQADLERAVIRAPIKGRILKIFTKQGESIPQEGTMLQMGNTKQMYAVAEVYETDIPLVKLGQKASITSPVLTEDVSGSVIDIGNLVYKNKLVDDDPAADTDARIVEVKVKLDNKEKLISNLTNLKVDVKISLGHEKKATKD